MNIADNKYMLQVSFQCPVPYSDTVLSDLEQAAMRLEGYIGQALERTCGSLIYIHDVKVRSIYFEDDGNRDK